VRYLDQPQSVEEVKMETRTEHKENRSEVLTVNEVCEALKCGRTLVNSYLWDGTLRSLKVGRRRLVLRSDLERFLEEHRDTPGA
jgi:excisionase family DNA binding protein